MGTTTAITVALTFTWLGMVLAISFVEAPLKFRAPEVTLRIGLGIGRIVFRALNAVELVLAAGIVAVAVADPPETGALVAVGGAVVVLAVQLLAIRPALTKRSDAVLAGTTAEDAPRSHAHLWYVAAEVLKVVALVTGGVLLLAG